MKRELWEITPEMYLTEPEVDQLLRHVRVRARRAKGRARARAVTDRLIIEGLLFSGLRSSEFCRLRIADTVVGHGRAAFVVRGRRGASRGVGLPGHVCELVRTWVRDIRPALLPDGVSPEDHDQPMLFNQRSQPYKRTGLYRRVVRVLASAGLGSKASVQLLRHTYGYLAYLRTGGNLLFVQRQLGHAHPMVTAVYAALVEESYSAMAERVAGGWALGLKSSTGSARSRETVKGAKR